MQPLRGIKDILPHEIKIWQEIYHIANKILSLNNYSEIRTPIIESTNLFTRSIGNDTDIVNKEMYSFSDQGNRNITLRPEGTASIARAFISNQMYVNSKIHKLWYLGPMFRYERPQQGRQRQFHQLGIELIGCPHPIADVEVIRLAIQILKAINYREYQLEINSIGNLEERQNYCKALINYLIPYKSELDEDSQKRLINNPLRILDSKNSRTQEILLKAPKLKSHLKSQSIQHFNKVCKQLKNLNIPYYINENLVRGLDYYNYTAFEIKTKLLNNQSTICGGGRYDTLIEQLGGPHTPSVGWAIGLERLILLMDHDLKSNLNNKVIYLALKGDNAQIKIWEIIKILEKQQLHFEIDISNSNLNKQLKRANILGSQICFIFGDDEINNNYITIKWLYTGKQITINIDKLEEYLKYIKKYIKI
uniref:histidine--tRNA ligase n=1 Tax=Plumaria plumosa TaxID=189642 RepID=A0A4D6WX97_9FLOR|nr:Histidine-tRNA ligase [Plumaria plumosa]